jgi:hypothetical protein
MLHMPHLAGTRPETLLYFDIIASRFFEVDGISAQELLQLVGANVHPRSSHKSLIEQPSLVRRCNFVPGLRGANVQFFSGWAQNIALSKDRDFWRRVRKCYLADPVCGSLV